MSVIVENAIDLAYTNKDNKRLQEKVFQKYTWKEAAKATLKGYEMAMNRR